MAQGTEWKTWGGVLPKATPNKAGILKASLDGGSFTISYDQSGDWEVHLVPLGFDQKIAIQAGENAGRTLQHDFVALSHEVIPAKSFPVVLKSSATDSAKAVAIWISRSGENAPVQVVGGWLR